MNPTGNTINLVDDHQSGLWVRNPVMIASGTFGEDGYGKNLSPTLDFQKIGAIVAKTTTLLPRTGNPKPRFIQRPGWTLNSIGLENPGIKPVLDIHSRIWKDWQVPVILSIAGERIEEYGELAKKINGTPGIAGLELNISCPNVAGGLEFGQDSIATSEVVSLVKENTALPILVKLSPNVTNIEEIALAAESSGANALTICNTLVGIDVDPAEVRSQLGTTTGGISGPALKPIALSMVRRTSKVVQIPVIGVGGISSLHDALSYFMVGARAIQIGVATYVDPHLPLEIIDGLEKYKNRYNLDSLDAIVGLV